MNLSDNSKECKIKLLEFYGFEGLMYSIDYKSLVSQMNNDYCPNIVQTCCSRIDFLKIQRQWDERVRNIKKYVTKIFRVIQKITVLQSSLMPLSKMVKEKNTDRCREVDFTFFNSPINYEEVYFYTENALEAFTFMQKGFYCMLCDADSQDYLAIEMGYTRRLNQISHKFCNDLIFFFREFIMFKVYYLDPLMINTRMLYNCYEDKDVYDYNLFYNTTYPTIKTCLDEGKECEFICKEFKFGTTSELFIGKLSKYQKFLKEMQDIINKIEPDSDLQINSKNSELYVDDKFYAEEFFEDFEQDLKLETDYVLNQYNMTNFEIQLGEEGINLIEQGINSHLYLTNSMTNKQVIKSYGVDNPGQDSNQKGGSQLDTFAYELETIPNFFNQERYEDQENKEKDQFEKFREIQRLKENPIRPSKEALIDLAKEIPKKEQQLDDQLRKEDFEFNEENQVDFGKAGEIKGLKNLIFSLFIFLVYQLD